MAKDYNIQVVINGKDNASGVMKKFSQGAQKWLNIAAKAAIAASLAFGGMSMKWSMDYEAQMDSVQAVSRATVGEMAALDEKAKQLGRDSAFSATQTGEAMEYLAMAGLKPAQVLASVEDTLNLAAAGTLALGEAADIASNVLTGFNLKAEEMGRVADVMAMTAASSNTNIQQLGDAMSYVAPQAAAAGWSLEETSAAIGMLGNAGIQGSMAGTVLRGAINGLLDPSDEARKAINNLGLVLTDNNGKMLSLEEILRQIDPAVLDTADGLSELTKIFGTRATPGIIALVKQGADNLAAFKNNLMDSGGAAEEMARIKLSNLKGAMTLLKSSLEGVGLALVGGGGEQSLLSSMQTYVNDAIIPALNATSEWIDQMGGVPGILSATWEILTTFAEDVKTALVNLFTDWDTFSQFAVLFGQALAVAIGTMGKFTTEIMLAIAHVALSIWLPLVAPFSVMLSQIKELFGLWVNWLGQKVVNGANMLLEPFRWAFEKLGIEIGEINWNPITVDPALKMEEVWPAATGVVAESFNEAKDNVILGAKDMIENFALAGEGMKTALEVANPEFINYSEKMGNIIEKHKEMGSTGVAAAEEMVTAVEKIPAAMDEVASSTESGSRIWNAFSSLGNHIQSSLSSGWDMYMENIPTLEESLQGHMNNMGLVMERELGDSFTEMIKTGEFTFDDGMKAIGDAGAAALGEALSQQTMKRIIGPAVDFMVGLFDEGFGGILGLAKNAISGIGNALSGGTGGVGSIAGAANGIAGSGGTGALAAVGSVALPVAALFAGVYGLGTLADKYLTGTSAGHRRWADMKDNPTSSIEELAAIVDSMMKEYDMQGSNPDDIAGYITTISRGSTRPEMFSHQAYSYAAFLGLQDVLTGAISYATGMTANELLNIGRTHEEYKRLMQTTKINAYHSGGVLGEGLFLGLPGEGVLNRNAMGMLGREGLNQLNNGRMPGKEINITIYAMDGESVERVVRQKIVPILKETSEAGEYVIHENGIKGEVYAS